MKTIQEILESHDTDKHNANEHSYGDVYAEVFEKFDRNAEINILELGVQRGGSLFAWKEFFPNANVYGVDISDSRLDKYKTDPRILFFKEDLKDATKYFAEGTFDIIIDDSDHFDGTIAWIIKNYWKFLKPKGIMVIEDIQIVDRYTATIEEAVTRLIEYLVLKLNRKVSINIDHFDMRSVKGRPDDYIITLQHD